MNSYDVMLGLPGPNWTPGAMLGVIQTTAGHRVDVVHEGASWDNFNILWGRALARAKAGEITHHAQLHSDMAPQPQWLDVGIEEMEKKNVSFISGVPALKDRRLLTSCGVGNPASEWAGSFRRLTVWELARKEWRVPGRGMVAFPETFHIGDIGYPDKFLLHNNGCFIADLRDERFFALAENGDLAAFFHFVKRMRPVEINGNYGYSLQGESEDWAFSRRIHQLGIPSAATSRIFLDHGGYPNRIMADKDKLPWFQDEESRQQWDDTAPDARPDKQSELISSSYELGYGEPHADVLERVAKEFSGQVYGAEFGVAWGGTLEIAAKYLRANGTIWGFDTFTGHPEHVAQADMPEGDNEVVTMRPHYAKHGTDGLSIDFQRRELRRMGVDNAILVPGLVTRNSCWLAGIPKLHYAHLDMDILESMQAGYAAVLPLIVKGGYLILHDCYQFPRLRNWLRLELIPSGLWEVVTESPQTLYCVMRRK